jgi:hypothetical protein
MGTPQNTIESPNYSKAELEKGADALVAAGGAWDRVKESSERIYGYMNLNMYADDSYVGSEKLEGRPSDEWYEKLFEKPVNQRLRPYRGDFTPKEYNVSGGSLIISINQHCWPNGPGAVLQVKFKDKKFFPDIEKNVRVLIEEWDVAPNPEGREKFLQERPEDYEEEYFYHSIKPRSETLAQFPREVEKWIAANADVIPEGDQKLIAEEIANYRQAYSEIRAFVDYAKEYMQHIDGKAKETELGA